MPASKSGFCGEIDEWVKGDRCILHILGGLHVHFAKKRCFNEKALYRNTL